MFLKFLDDLEIQREGEAKLAGKKFKPAIEPPYRWRDWAAKSNGITGDELLAFILHPCLKLLPGIWVICGSNLLRPLRFFAAIRVQPRGRRAALRG